jgi:hypothetical protein
MLGFDVMIATDPADRSAATPAATDHVFYTTMAFVMTAVVFTGFARTYSARIAAGTTTPLIHLHGAIFAAWMALYITQSLLVLRGATRLHRKVGVAGTFFGAGLIVVGAVTSVVAARHGYSPPCATCSSSAGWRARQWR